MKKKVKAKTFTLLAIHNESGSFYAFSDSLYRALCCDFVKNYLGKTPRKIKVRVRTTMAAGYTKVRRKSHCPWVLIGGAQSTLFWATIQALDSVFGTRKTFYFKITEAK